MKLLYLAAIRLPTEKAHGIQIMKMCEAFARTGVKVELVVPTRNNTIDIDPFDYYGVERIFTITTLPVPDCMTWGRVGFLIQTLRFAYSARRYLRHAQPDLIYSRDKMVVLMLSRATPFVWEIHTKEFHQVIRILGKRAKAVVTITHALAAVCSVAGVPKEKSIVAPDAVDLADFAHPENMHDARARLRLPLNKKIVLYVGRLDGWKGVDTLCVAASYLTPDIGVVVIGGEPEQVVAFKHTYPEVTFVGYRPYAELADNQAAADVLVLPNSGTDETSVRYTSPLKLFTYLMSGKPIIASDLPSLREIIDESMAYFCIPDDPTDLARVIITVLAEYPAALSKAEKAFAVAQTYSWNARAQHILRHLSPL